MSATKKTLGQVIRAAREIRFKDLKYTGPMREALAKKAKVTPGYLSIIENDSPAHVSVDLLGRICHALDINSDKLESLRVIACDVNRAYEAKRKQRLAAQSKKSSKKTDKVVRVARAGGRAAKEEAILKKILEGKMTPDEAKSALGVTPPKPAA